MMRKIKCFFGLHGLDSIKYEGKFLVQRCLYCDKLVHKFDSSKNVIRKIQ